MSAVQFCKNVIKSCAFSIKTFLGNVLFVTRVLFGLIWKFKYEIKDIVFVVITAFSCLLGLWVGGRFLCVLGIKYVIQCVAFGLVPTIVMALFFIICGISFYLLKMLLQRVLFKMGVRLKRLLQRMLFRTGVKLKSLLRSVFLRMRQMIAKIIAFISPFWKGVKKEIFNDDISIKKIICLLILFLIGPLVQFYVSVCGPIVEHENIPSFASGILGVQATMFTIVIALLSLITGKENIFLGMEIKKFYLQCDSKVFSQKGVVFIGIVLILISTITLFLEMYNIVFVMFLYSLFLIGLSAHRIYEVFFGSQVTFEKKVSEYFSDVEKFETSMLAYHLDCLMEDMKNNRELNPDDFNKYQELKCRMEHTLFERGAF